MKAESTCRQRTCNDRDHYSREHYLRSWSVHELNIKLYRFFKELGVRKMCPHVDSGLVVVGFITLVYIILGIMNYEN